MGKVTIISHVTAIREAKEQKIAAALQSMGKAAVNLTQDGMLTLYPNPVFDTGALHDDVQAGEQTARSIEVGNTLHYAPYVHEGTYKMAGRPYLVDSLTGNHAVSVLKEAALRELEGGT